jgi:fructose-bisphosphate aldolase, class I
VNKDMLKETASGLVSAGKGILATDSTEKTMNKRLKEAGIEQSAEIRRAFRELLLTSENIEEYINGVILNDEIIRQKTSGGAAFPKLLEEKGIAVGIKVDKGAQDMANFPGEKVTDGLDGLRDRLAEYKEMGVSFAKWRAVITIGRDIPTQFCINSNAECLARYAALCQEQDIVPIVEPEVVMDGDHGLERCADVTTSVLRTVFTFLKDHKVQLDGILLKSNMVLPGKESEMMVSDEDAARTTLEVLKRSVPEEVAGIVFLSGGQESVDATRRLNEISRLGDVSHKLSFSFERALMGTALTVYQGKDEMVEPAQKEFIKRARLNSLASQGKYTEEMEK